MGQALAKPVLLVTTLAGCSILYDPGQLKPAADAPPPPVVCDQLKLDRVSPAELLEGQGDGGSRPAVLVVHGQNIATGATVSVFPHGQPDKPLPGIDKTMFAIDRAGLQIAVPIKLDVDTNLAAGQSIPLDVKVTQPCASAPGGVVEFSLADGGAPAVTLRGLGELIGTPSLPTATPNLYSRVNVTGITAADTARPLIIRSTSSITIGGSQPVSVSAPLNQNSQSPGPGGFAGGNGGPPGVLGGAGDGQPGGGPGGGVSNGGGGGFAETGKMGTTGSAGPGGPVAGDAPLITLDSPNRGSGGAGGRGAALVGGSAGGPGGGGGGSLELTAAGDLVVTVPIEAKGGKGLTGPSNGGGGAGGVVLLRAGGKNLMVGNGTSSVTATGGLPGGSDAGAGSVGRIRVDSPIAAIPFTPNPPIGYRGPMFASSTPLIVHEAKPRLTIVGEKGALIKYTIEDDGGTTRGPVDLTMASTGESTAQLATELFEGYNKICALVTGVIIRREEAENCITLAYVRTE